MLWPSPGIDAVTSKPFDSLTLATFLNAELGFLGVVVYTRIQTPLLCGHSIKAGTLFFLPRYSQTINRVTGSGVQTVNCNFKLIEEQVWLGGLKQKRGIDYFQISSGNLLTSTAVIPTYGQNIVNNPSTFLKT